ncbi:tryptophan synthase subunit alpha [Streptomyces sp. NPDC086182]|uniref:tryptophan synthase subunit alpha n=1 Tax=Streptomyces sp. NPDC086182 TaxID=3155058 RepID=UPI00343C7CC7
MRVTLLPQSPRPEAALLCGPTASRAINVLQRGIDSERLRGWRGLAACLPVRFPDQVTGRSAAQLVAPHVDVVAMGAPHAGGMLDCPAVHTAPASGLTSSVSGVLAPALSSEKVGTWLKVAGSVGFGAIALGALSPKLDLVERMVTAVTGTVCAPALDGVTGKPQLIRRRLSGLSAEAHGLTSLPVAAGFGSSTPAQARTVTWWATCVVIGSTGIWRMQTRLRARLAATGGGEFTAALHLRAQAGRVGRAVRGPR